MGWSATSLLLLVASFLLLLVVVVNGEEGYFIRTTKNYTIDGDDEDWAQTTTHPINDQVGNTIARWRGGYNIDFFYLFVTVEDATPLVNVATPGTFQEMFYTGDAISFCLGPYLGVGIEQRFVVGPYSDGTIAFYVIRPSYSPPPSNNTGDDDDSEDDDKSYLYYTTASNEYEVDYVWHLDQGNTTSWAALVKTPTGWNAEIRIPWSEVGYIGRYNNLLPFDIEVLSSNIIGDGIVGANWWHSRGAAQSTVDIVSQARLYSFLWGVVSLTSTDVGPQTSSTSASTDPAFVTRGVPVEFTVPDDNLVVSINIIENDSDFIVAELLRAKPMPKGKATVYWSGRDRENRPVLGNRKYRAKIGSFPPIQTKLAASIGNSGSPSWYTADGKGSLGGVHYGSKYIISADVYYENATVRPRTGDIYLSASVDEGVSGIRRMTPSLTTKWTATAGVFRSVQGIATNGDVLVHASSSGGSVTLTGYRSTGEFGYLTATIRGAKFSENSTLVLVKRTIFYGDALTGLIYTSSYASSKWGNFTTLNFAGFVTFCSSTDPNFLYIVYPTEVYKYYINTSTQATTPFITGYTELRACTVDKNGNFFVAEAGTKNQIFKYRPSGSLVFTFGLEGGRGLRAVPYNKMRFKYVRSLAVDFNNTLYIVERNVAPGRMALLDATTGEWKRDFYGPTSYATNIVDLDDASTIYYSNPHHSGNPWFVEVKINYTAYEKDPNDNLNGFAVKNIHYLSQNGKDNTTTGTDVLMDWVYTANGYGNGIMFTGTNGFKYMFISSTMRPGQAILKWDETAKVWYPVAAIQTASGGDSWSDSNHDHMVTRNETYELNGYFTSCDRDLVLYSTSSYLVPSFIDSKGVPYYNNSTSTSRLRGANLSSSFYCPSGITTYSVVGGPGQSTKDVGYAACNMGPERNQGFWDRASDVRILKMSNNVTQWVMGHRDYSQAQTGDVSMIFPYAGEVDDVFMFSDVTSQYVSYFSDGLTIGWVLKTNTTVPQTPTTGYNSINVENAGQGLFMKDPVTGKRLLISMTTGDTRVLEVIGPFGDAVKRQIVDLFLPNSWPRRSSDDGNTRASAYSLNYVTMGNGGDGTFYVHYRNYTDGYDYEWPSTVPTLYVYDNQSTIDPPPLVAEIRMRRDAGELGIFGTVLDEKENFPFLPRRASLTTPTRDLFGVAGVEILLGLAQDGRTSARQGDTRIFISGTYSSNGNYNAFILGSKPASTPLNLTGEFRNQYPTGGYNGDSIAGKIIDFSRLTPIPGSTVSIRTRVDQKGYQFEAYIPLAFFPELTSRQNVTYLRSLSEGTTTGTASTVKTSVRSDFKEFPFGLNVAVFRPTKFINDQINETIANVQARSNLKRYPWMEDGFSGLDQSQMNPSKWGAISRPPQLNFMVVDNSGSFPPLSYMSTITSRPQMFDAYSASVTKNGIYGGGWYTVNNVDQLVTSPVPVEGFSLTYVSGAGNKSDNTIWRWARWSPTKLFITQSSSSVNAQLVYSDLVTNNDVNMTLRLTTKFPEKTVGVLHVLWGQQGGNTAVNGWLQVTDTISKITISGLNRSYSDDLRIPNAGLQGQIAKESKFLISGTNDLLISHTRATPRSTQYAYMSAVWVEMYTPTSFVSPANISMYQLGYGIDAAIQSFTYFHNDIPIGTARPGEVFTWRNVNAGAYELYAVANDRFQSSRPSLPVTITVYGPLITDVSPLNNTALFNPLKVSFTVNKVGPNEITKIEVHTIAGGTKNKVASLQSSESNVLTGASLDPISLPVGKVVILVRIEDSAKAYSEAAYVYEIKENPPPSDDVSSCHSFFPLSFIMFVLVLLVVL